VNPDDLEIRLQEIEEELAECHETIAHLCRDLHCTRMAQRAVSLVGVTLLIAACLGAALGAL